MFLEVGITTVDKDVREAQYAERDIPRLKTILEN